MNKSMKLVAAAVALLAATFVVIKAADAQTRRQSEAAVASAPEPETDSSTALPLEQD